MVELRFYRLELLVVAFLVFWVFWSYGPNSPARPVAVDGVLARFNGSISIAGRPTPFFFGLATAPAHVEDKARLRALAPRFSSALTAAAAG